MTINTKERERSLKRLTLAVTEHCPKPIARNKTYASFKADESINKSNGFIDFLWFLCRTLAFVKSKIVTWAAFNSLVGCSKPVTPITTLPLVQGSPTDWSNLYASLKVCQNISKSTHKCKTVVSLDLQLYSKVLQLKGKEEINNNFIFRLGELHVVFAFLKVIGKFIENSGLDQILVESGIYGPTTLRQILEGKHMKRCIEAYMYLYLVLFKLYIDKLLEANSDIHKVLYPLVSSFITNFNHQNVEINEDTLNIFLNSVNQVQIANVINQFDEQLKGQAKFYRNFMYMYEALLLFIRASRQSDWLLHLNSLNKMIPYFFAHDQQNYARLSPVYLSEMEEVRNNEKDIWNFFREGNFSVQKRDIPFTAIGADHALEQENKNIKVLGGVKGLL